MADEARPARAASAEAARAAARDHGALARYAEELFAAEDDVLRRVRARADRAGMPAIQLPPATAKALQVLVAASGGRMVVEVGTLAGYSAIWIARALAPEGRLVTLEIDPGHARVAQRSIEDAGLADRVDIRLGDAMDQLRALGPDGAADLVFLDADKERYADYLQQAARLLRPGGVLAADNTLWKGRVTDPGDDPLARHIARFNRMVAGDARFEATILPVGDGLLVAARR